MQTLEQARERRPRNLHKIPVRRTPGQSLHTEAHAHRLCETINPASQLRLSRGSGGSPKPSRCVSLVRHFGHGFQIPRSAPVLPAGSWRPLSFSDTTSPQNEPRYGHHALACKAVSDMSSSQSCLGTCVPRRSWRQLRTQPDIGVVTADLCLHGQTIRSTARCCILPALA